MSYLALDIRNPKKCVRASYPENARLDVIYEVLDPKKDKLNMGIKSPDGPLTQTRVTFTVVPSSDSEMMKRTAKNMLSHDVKKIQGKIQYRGEGEGYVDVCVNIQEAPGRKYVKPALIAFRVTESDVEEPEVPVDSKTQDAAKQHLSGMEKILIKMISTTNLLVKNADSIKSDESDFHKQSIEMNAASKWWPMLHVMVLLGTGFTQANHIVKYFKSRHII